MAGHSTAVYSAVLAASRELKFGVGDFAIHQQISPNYVSYSRGYSALKAL